MTDLQMKGKVITDEYIDYAITDTFIELDMNHIRCLDDLVALTNARNLHGKLTDEMAQSDKPISMAKQLSNEIQSQGHDYGSKATKSARTKL